MSIIMTGINTFAWKVCVNCQNINVRQIQLTTWIHTERKRELKKRKKKKKQKDRKKKRKKEEKGKDRGREGEERERGPPPPSTFQEWTMVQNQDERIQY